MNSADPLHRRVESYRESCDNCAKSKVRCGKEQPWCQRCVRRGQVCSYSPSQRSRKRTLSTTQAEGEQRADALPFSAMSSSASTTSKQDASVLLGQTDTWGTCPDLVELLISGSSAESLTPDNANLVWLSDMESIAGDRSGSKSLDRADAFMLPRDSGIGAPSLRGIDSSLASVDNMAVRLMSSITDRQHCEADLISALAKLDLPSLSYRGEPKTSQNLGTILTASRSALSCASKTVSCTCTPNDNVALLATAVLLRILSWYEIVLQSYRGPGDDSSSAGVDSYNSPAASPDNDELERPSTRDTEMSHDGSEGSGLFVPPMTIGPYELDAENRERMIGHIMLSELSKMGRLLSSFSKKFCDPQSITLGSDNKSQLYLALEMFIRNKHSVTVLAVRKKLEGK
ncbi:aurR1 [Fusarium albosuccineum]|uniref:AurR1 n=1 Tax=Fusarium albosuccineum TaxID=1237068 RepID=A0A8H4L254_9HYPO|nr:aurR1 [Fusarium albosuccineum]